MYCGSCGAEREDGARFCKRCGRALDEPAQGVEAQAPEPPPHVENYLVQAILVTIFLLPAVRHRVDRLRGAGQREG